MTDALANEDALWERPPRGLDRARGITRIVTAAVVASVLVVLIPWIEGSASAFLVFVAVATILFAGVAVARAGGIADRLRWRWRTQSADPRAPWLSDHTWTPLGHDPQSGFAGRSLLSQAFLVAAIVILGTSTIVASVLFGWTAGWLFAVVPSTLWAIALWWRWGRGAPYVSFTRFPYHPGEPVELHFGVTPGGREILRAHFRLRRVAWRRRSCWSLAEREMTFVAFPRGSASPLPTPHADVRLVFDIPSSAGGTSLSAPYPEYWELESLWWTVDGVVVERFLVPIYERPASTVPA